MGHSAGVGPCPRRRARRGPPPVSRGHGLLALLLAGWVLGLSDPATARLAQGAHSSATGLVHATAMATRGQAAARLAQPAAAPLPASPPRVPPPAGSVGNVVGPLAAPPSSQGIPDTQRVRDQSLAAVRADPDAWIRRYLLRVTSRCTPQGVVIRTGTADLGEAMRRGPLLISADEAKELFPAFARDHRSRSLYSGSVHEASLLITDLLWRRALARPLRPQRDLVLFSGGGVASGKTYALTHSAAARALMSRTEIVQDSTMSDRRRAQDRIDQALAGGRSVQVIYVFTPIEQAVHWLVERGMRAGRSVAAAAVARSHWQSQATVLALADHYRGRPAVRFGLLVNGLGASGELRPIEDLRPLRAAADPRFPDQLSFRRHVDALVRQELRARHQDADPTDPTPELERSLQPGD